MRVLLVAAANSTDGGGEKHVADLLVRLTAAGVDVALAAPAGGDLEDIAAACRVDTFDTQIQEGLAGRAARTLRSVIARVAPDVVHAHGARAAAYARVADPLARRRVVYTLHGIHVDQVGAPQRRAMLLGLERLLRPRTARFVCVCRSDAVKGARLGLLDLERTAVVHNGIDPSPRAAPAGGLRSEIGARADALVVLSVGRLHEQKDQATLLRAFGRTALTHLDALLVLIGAGELEGELRRLVEEGQLGRRVWLLPPRPDLGPAYADADVFALSSRWEGLPYVVLEAMAFGLPVAATNVDGIREAVRDGRTGLLVNPDDAESLGDALSRLLSSAEMRERMGQAGRARIRAAFTTDQMIVHLLQVYREITGGAGLERGRGRC